MSIEGQNHFLTLAQGRVHTKSKNGFSQKLLCRSEPNLVRKLSQGQLIEGVECHIYMYCFTFDDINLNRDFVIIVLFPKKYSNKKVCANDMRKRNVLGIY